MVNLSQRFRVFFTRSKVRLVDYFSRIDFLLLPSFFSLSLSHESSLTNLTRPFLARPSITIQLARDEKVFCYVTFIPPPYPIHETMLMDF